MSDDTHPHWRTHEDFGPALRGKCRDLDLTQEQLAEAADLYCIYVSGIERGIRNVSILRLCRIAEPSASKYEIWLENFNNARAS